MSRCQWTHSIGGVRCDDEATEQLPISGLPVLLCRWHYGTARLALGHIPPTLILAPSTEDSAVQLVTDEYGKGDDE